MPARHCFSALLLATLSLCATAPMAWAGTLEIELGHLPCRDGARLATELSERLKSSMAGQGESRLSLRLIRSDRLLVRMEGEQNFEREIPFDSADCDALPIAVSMVVRGWRSQRFALEEQRQDNAPRELLEENSRAPVPPRLEIQSPPRVTSTEASVLAGLWAGAAMMQSSTGVSPPFLSLGALVDLPIPSLGEEAGAALSLDYARGFALALPNATLTASLFALASMYRHTLAQGPFGSVALQTGPALYLVLAKTEGLSPDGAQQRLGVAWSAGARWLIPFTTGERGALPLYGMVALSASARWRTERFELLGFKDRLAIPSLQAVMELGLAAALP